MLASNSETFLSMFLVIASVWLGLSTFTVIVQHREIFRNDTWLTLLFQRRLFQKKV